MQSLTIVENFDEIENRLSRFGAGGKPLMVHPFALDVEQRSAECEGNGFSSKICCFPNGVVDDKGE